MTESEEKKIDERIDITKEFCPMTFVKTKLKLESMRSGQTLEVTLKDGEPIRNVPKSIKEEGHKILDVHKDGSVYKLLIERR
ncbi:MAG: sulfurtransferase TusA family protein [Deltaproteobacteria bacterium]